MALRINPPASAMPTYDNFRDDGTPNIEVSNSVYYYRARDRDTETMNQQTADLNLLLYWIFRDITFSMACKYELTFRNYNQDSRRIMFKRQVELLTQLSPEWGERGAREQAKILEQSPFNDDYDARAVYAQELEKQGVPPEVRWKMVKEKYPPAKEGYGF